MPVSRHSHASGVTLLDLLVVIAILIILAGVAIVAGNSARTKAYNTQALVCGEQIRKAQTLYYSENQTFADALNKLNAEMVARCDLVTVVSVTATAQGYRYTVAHQQGNTQYTIEDDRASTTTLAGGAVNGNIGAPTPTWPTTPIPAGRGRVNIALISEGGTNSVDMLRLTLQGQPAQVCVSTRICTITADLAPGTYTLAASAAIYPPDTAVNPTTGVGTSPSGGAAPSLASRVTGTVGGTAVGPVTLGTDIGDTLLNFSTTVTVTAGQTTTVSLDTSNGETGNGGLILTNTNTSLSTNGFSRLLYKRGGTTSSVPWLTYFTGSNYLPNNSTFSVNDGLSYPYFTPNSTFITYTRATGAGTYDLDCGFAIMDPSLNNPAAHGSTFCAAAPVTVEKGTWKTLTPPDLFQQTDVTLTINLTTPQNVTRMSDMNIRVDTWRNGSASSGGFITHTQSPSVTVTASQIVIRFKGFASLPSGANLTLETYAQGPNCYVNTSNRVAYATTMTVTATGNCP